MGRKGGGKWQAGEQASKASSIFIAAPHSSNYHLSSPPIRSVAALDSHRNAQEPATNYAWKGSRLHAFYENHTETVPHPLSLPSLWKSCLPGNQSVVLKRLGTAAIENLGSNND